MSLPQKIPKMGIIPKKNELVAHSAIRKRRMKSLNNNSSLDVCNDIPSTDNSKVLSFDAYGNLTASNDPNTVYSQSVPSIEEFNLILDSFEGTPPKKKFKETNKSKSEKAIKSSTVKQDNSLSEIELKQVFKSGINMRAKSRYGRTRKQRSADGYMFGTINFKELNKVTSSRKSSAGEEQSAVEQKNGAVEPYLPIEIPKDDKEIEAESLEMEEQNSAPTLRKRKTLIEKDKIDNKVKRKKLSSSNKRKKLSSSNKRKYSIDIKSSRKQSIATPIKNMEEDSLIDNKCTDESQLSELNQISTKEEKIGLFEAQNQLAEQKTIVAIDNKEIKKCVENENKTPTLRNTKTLVEKGKFDNILKTKKLSLNKRNLSIDPKTFTKQAIDMPIKTLEEDSLINNKCTDDSLNLHESQFSKCNLVEEISLKQKKVDSLEQKPKIEADAVVDNAKIVKTSISDFEMSEQKPLVPLSYSNGDLLWIYIKGNPLWPSILTCPSESNIFTKIVVGTKKKPVRLYHVLFLNDCGRTLWVNPKNILLFNGKEKLLSFLENLKEMEKEKKVPLSASNPMLKTLAILHRVNGVKFIRWQEGINQADELLPLAKEDRMEYLNDKNDIIKKPIKLKKKTLKRLQQTIKSSKRENKALIDESDSDDDFLGFDNSMIDEGKIKQKKLKEKVTDGFDVYVEKHLKSYMDKHKNIVKEKAVKVLYSLWKRLTYLQKNRYRSMSGGKINELVLDTDYSSDSSSSSNNYGSKKLAKGTYKLPRHEKVCHKCNGRKEKDGSNIVRCKGVCSSTFHLACLDLTVAPEGDFKCVSCLSGVHSCFICKSSENKVVKCTVSHCGKFYHYECVRKWPQVSKAKYNEKLVCPRHMCHMCAANADDMNDLAAKTPPFTKCLLCPTTYHTGEACIAAGVEEITHQYHICTKHLEIQKSNNFHCNVNWCFCCSKGGSLLLCDQCPSAFHAECLNITAPEGDFVCEDCENGKFPIYGDVVWVKLGSYRWWPGQVLHPKYIPDNIENLSHRQGMFCVHFFGSDDYFWVSRGRVFLYQEGDQGSKGSSSRPIEQQFRKAMNEAINAYREQKKRTEEQEATRSLKGNKKPPPYVRIEVNKPVGNVRFGRLDLASVTKCECDPFSQNPCGFDDKCLNRMLMVECVPQVCASGDRCNNQRFQKRQYPSVQPFRTSARGWGLKTNDFIQKGEFIIEYVGELVDEQELKRRIVEMQDQNEENYYFLTIDKEHIIDAGPKGNLSRFMNHSCQPNCETQKWTVGADTRVGLFALDDIGEGSELIFNYNLECVGTEKKKCHCGASQCSGFIGAKVQKEKSTKAESFKKKKKKKKKDKKDTEDECFRCGVDGNLVLCDLSTCPKAYHLHCLNLKTLPKGKWICPWHHCDDCGFRAIYRCIFCPNSYCRLHSQDKFVDCEKAICQDHNPDEIQEAKADGLTSASSSDTTSREQTPDVLTT